MHRKRESEREESTTETGVRGRRNLHRRREPEGGGIYTGDEPFKSLTQVGRSGTGQGPRDCTNNLLFQSPTPYGKFKSTYLDNVTTHHKRIYGIFTDLERDRVTEEQRDSSAILYLSCKGRLTTPLDFLTGQLGILVLFVVVTTYAGDLKPVQTIRLCLLTMYQERGIKE